MDRLPDGGDDLEPDVTARDIAHRYARKAHLCGYNKHSDRHQEHSELCEALATDIQTAMNIAAARATEDARQ